MYKQTQTSSVTNIRRASDVSAKTMGIIKKYAELLHNSALVAQWIRRRFPKPKIEGSSPSEGTIYFILLSFPLSPDLQVLTFTKMCHVDDQYVVKVSTSNYSTGVLGG